MIENRRVAAFGDAKRFVEQVSVGDTVFYSHRWLGVVAAAKVRSRARADGSDTLYCDVEFVTPVPQRGDGTEGDAVRQGREVTGRSFYWARTVKVPFLSKEEATRLVEELPRYLGPSA